MSSLFSVILFLFWLTVFGMVFGSVLINEISHYFFYVIGPITLILGIYEIVNKQNQPSSPKVKNERSDHNCNH